MWLFRVELQLWSVAGAAVVNVGSEWLTFVVDIVFLERSGCGGGWSCFMGGNGCEEPTTEMQDMGCLMNPLIRNARQGLLSEKKSSDR